MLNGKLIKVDRVIESVQRDYGFENLDWINCVEWIGECLDLIGAPRTFIEKATDGKETLGHPECIKIEENRGKLPCDMHELIQAFRLVGESYIPMRVNTDTTHVAYNCMGTEDFYRESEITLSLIMIISLLRLKKVM
jgi:hypothetical protein